MSTLAALGKWPTPKLDAPTKVLGFTTRQWLYVVGGYAAWDWLSKLILWAVRSVLLVRLEMAAAGMDRIDYIVAETRIRVMVLPPQWHLAGLALCVLLGLGLAFFHWHGRDAWGWGSVLLDVREQVAFTVWRPVPLEWDDGDAGRAEEDDEDDDRAAEDDAPRATDANPFGWDVGGHQLAELEAAAGWRARPYR